MPKVCFVPGCKTTSRYSRNGKIALFSVPQDPVLRKRWHIASRRADREIKKSDLVCELHFTEDCIERYFTTDLGNGEIFHLERERIRLKKGSIPTIFSFSNSNSVAKRGRTQKLCTVQGKENGNGSSDLRKKTSPSKYLNQVLVCSAFGCNNSSDMELRGISFHNFPTNKTQRTWMSDIGKNYVKSSRKSVICSAHFADDQFLKTSSYVKLKHVAIPTIFPLDYNLDKNESCSSGIDDFPAQDSDESYADAQNEEPDDAAQDEKPVFETIYIVQDGNDEILEEVSSSYKNTPLENFISKKLIAEGYEEVFGKFVANELKILSCDPPLYLRTKEKIWQALEKASQSVK